MTATARELASAFSTRVVRELSKPHPALWAQERIVPIAELVDADVPLRLAFEAAHEQLASNYRCEYVYKSAVIKQAIATEPSAHAMTGLPVFLSIADVVVAGEAASAFEIKTDLDSFTRLELQVLSYSRCFEFVHVVTSEAKAARVLDALPAHVGVRALNEDSLTLTTVRPASGGHSRLDPVSLFRVLRQSERLAVLHRRLGYTVDVPSALLYRRTAELFTSLPLDAAYQEFVTELRHRDARQRAAAAAAALPASLAAAAAGLTLSAVAWQRLGQLLQKPVAQLANTTHGWAA
ncbi:sce7726 family protein [Mycobacterium avium]|uniref:sce7726 family protein n=1 Tax=Mycobacterium avium TaxID=1764 RepID=UPI001CDB437C|nr:sce7726 family protein [Mycobacterium avium]MCA2337267.1 sce7726 family protein [Mycobacterium avium]